MFKKLMIKVYGTKESHKMVNMYVNARSVTVFRRCFTLVKRTAFFSKMTELTLNWSIFNRFGQIGQIDGLDYTRFVP